MAGVAESTATGAAAGASFGPWGAGIGAGIGLAGGLMSASAQRRAADNRATALKAAANRRLTQGKQQADLLKAQGGMNQTSEFSSELGRGISREDVASGGSLVEIAGRAQYASDQALEQAQLDANSILQDSQAVSQEGRDAQAAGAFNTASSILSMGSKFYQAKYGKAAGWNSTIG